MNHASLYSGIGGWLLAAQWAGIDNVFTCEIDKFCNKILDKHFPDTDRHHDIKETDFTKYRGAIDILSTSDPCQPFSVAGKRGGTTDDRFLWPQTIRVIREIKPAYVIFENVPGLLSMENGKTLEGVLVSLENEGYEIEPFDIPACAVGAWHRRSRLWFICYRRQINTNPGRIVKGGNKKLQEGFQYRGGGESFSEHTSLHQDVSNTESTNKGRLSKRKEKEYSRFELSSKDVSNSKCQRLQGSSIGQMEESIEFTEGDWWAVEPNVGRVVARFSSTLDETLNDYGYKNANNKKAITEIDKFRREILRDMWDRRNEVIKASHRASKRQSDDIMLSMSHGYSHEKWKLGTRIKENKDLSDMWQRILSKSFQKTQDLQSKMLEQIRKIECDEKVASSRVDRLKSLGNSIVPQIAYIIFEAIKDIDNAKGIE